MKLCTFLHEKSTRIGVVADDGVVDLAAAAPELPREMTALLAAGPDARCAAPRAPPRRRSDRLAARVGARSSAPILRPPKFLAIGLNYADHVAEAGLETPKLPDRLQQAVDLRHRPARPDPPAARLAGARLRGRARLRDRPALPPRAARARARGDRRLSRRERRHACATGSSASRPGRWASRSTRTARSDRGSRPPTRSAIPHGLRLRTWVNGELRQDSNTKHLIFDCFALVEHLSTAFTLEPGDVIATGTPGGVGIGDEAAAPARRSATACASRSRASASSTTRCRRARTPPRSSARGDRRCRCIACARITIGVPVGRARAQLLSRLRPERDRPGRFETSDGGEQLRVEVAPRRALLALSVGVDDAGRSRPRRGGAREARGRGVRATRVRCAPSSRSPRVQVELVSSRASRRSRRRGFRPTRRATRCAIDARSPGGARRAAVEAAPALHAVIASTDAAASRRFFTEGLGFRVSDEVPAIGAALHALLDRPPQPARAAGTGRVPAPHGLGDGRRRRRRPRRRGDARGATRRATSGASAATASARTTSGTCATRRATSPSTRAIST